MTLLLELGIGVVLALPALAFVLSPLYRPAAEQSVAALPHAVEETSASEQEQAARSALQEVELDYQLGNIAEADYRRLRQRYMRRALVSLKERYQREQEIDEQIEEQLRSMKERENDVQE